MLLASLTIPISTDIVYDYPARASPHLYIFTYANYE